MSDESFNPSIHEHYLQRGPFQHVAPYDHVYTAGVKGRWVGRTLLDVFSQEFPYHTAEYYRQAILDRRLEAVRSGRKRARDLPCATPAVPKTESQPETNEPARAASTEEAPVAPAAPAHPQSTRVLDMKLTLQHSVRHVVTRIEAPVLACGRIVITRFIHGSALGVERCAQVQLSTAPSTSAEVPTKESPSSVFRHPHDGIVVFSKPPGLPVHPCGRYSRNTLLHMVSLGLVTFAPGAFAGALGASVPRDGATGAEMDAHVLAKLGTTVEAFETFLRTATLHTAHRLDKGTSGAILVGTSGDMSKAMHRWLADKSSQATAPTPVNAPGAAAVPVSGSTAQDSSQPQGKTYIARVFGDFRSTVAAIQRTFKTPQDDSCEATVSWTLDKTPTGALNDETAANAVLNGAIDPTQVSVHVDRGVFSKHKRDGVSAVCTHSEEMQRREVVATKRTRELDGGGETYEQAKSAVSLFRFVSYDAATDQSLVECYPLTGRTHQLRLHLGPVLGHPILFDTMYTADGGTTQPDLPEHWTHAMTCSGTASVGGGADEPGQRSFMARQKALQQDTVRCASLFGLPSSAIGATDHVPPIPSGGLRDGFEHGAGAAGFGEEGFVLCLHAAVYRLPLAAPGAVAVCDAVSPLWAAS